MVDTRRECGYFLTHFSFSQNYNLCKSANVGFVYMFRVFRSRSKSLRSDEEWSFFSTSYSWILKILSESLTWVWTPPFTQVYIPRSSHSCTSTPRSACSQVFSAGFQGEHGGISTIYFPSNVPPPACHGFSGPVEDLVVELWLMHIIKCLTAHSSSQVANQCQSWLTFPGL